MKTIYINDAARKVIEEGILADALPDFITTSLVDKATSLKDNPLFDNDLLDTIVSQRFEETKAELRSIGKISDIEETDIETALAKLIQIAQEEERTYRKELEKVCLNYVIDFFEVPDDMIQLKLELVDEVAINSEVVQLDPIKDLDNSYEEESDTISITDEINKRRVLNALSMGAGMQISSNIKSYVADIYAINPKLPDLYRKILALNNYLLFMKNAEPTDENQMQLGTVLVGLRSQDNEVQITAQAKIFPVLLSETIRGFMDLFASHGLPKDRSIAHQIMSRADYLKAEPWDMRVGSSLWTLLSDSFDDVDSTLIPYLYKTIAKLNPQNFNLLMSETFAKSGRGARLMKKVIEKAKEEKEYDSFEGEMSKLKVDKSLLSDEINPDEL